MSDRSAGWVFVAVQGALFIALIVLPAADHWPTPGWLRLGGYALMALGLGVVGVASLGLGAALTPTPVPNGSGSLVTGGLYRYARHPIYTGVLIIIVGLTVRSGNLATAAVAVGALGFFHIKAGWEEVRLAAAYPDYEAYARTTRRFFPHP